MSKSKSRVFNHFLMTYAPIDVIQRALDFHRDLILAYAYIYHDCFSDVELKSEKGIPHYHIIIRTYQRHYTSAICKWFWCVDDNGIVNTFGESCGSVSSCVQYLIHSQNPDKYQYTFDDVVFSDRKYFLTDLSESDNLTQSYLDALIDTDPYLLVTRYGRDFICHSSQIFDLVARTKAWSLRDRICNDTKILYGDDDDN